MKFLRIANYFLASSIFSMLLIIPFAHSQETDTKRMDALKKSIGEDGIRTFETGTKNAKQKLNADKSDLTKATTQHKQANQKVQNKKAELRSRAARLEQVRAEAKSLAKTRAKYKEAGAKSTGLKKQIRQLESEKKALKANIKEGVGTLQTLRANRSEAAEQVNKLQKRVEKRQGEIVSRTKAAVNSQIRNTVPRAPSTNTTKKQTRRR